MKPVRLPSRCPLSSLQVAFCILIIAALACPEDACGQSGWLPTSWFSGDDIAPEAMFPLAENDGPWLVLATTFRGDGARDDARRLVQELRRDFKLKAYSHEKSFDYTGRQQGLGLNPDGSPKKMRYANSEQVTEVAVLVGDFASFDDSRAQKMLAKVKSLEPKAALGRERQEPVLLRFPQDGRAGSQFVEGSDAPRLRDPESTAAGGLLHAAAGRQIRHRDECRRDPQPARLPRTLHRPHRHLHRCRHVRSEGDRVRRRRPETRGTTRRGRRESPPADPGPAACRLAGLGVSRPRIEHRLHRLLPATGGADRQRQRNESGDLPDRPRTRPRSGPARRREHHAAFDRGHHARRAAEADRRAPRPGWLAARSGRPRAWTGSTRGPIPPVP